MDAATRPTPLNDSSGRIYRPTLNQIASHATPELDLKALELKASDGLSCLSKIKDTLTDQVSGSADAQLWIRLISNLQNQITRTEVIIGVVGNTGAGKSSVINAVLDEGQLLPTSSMKACTAVVIQLSFNYLNDKKYRAEVEFVSHEEWKKEVTVLLKDLLNEEGCLSWEHSVDDSVAGMAYAKLRSLYPHKSKDEITKADAKTVVADATPHIGKTETFEGDDGEKFKNRLRRYTETASQSTDLALWPLIKAVRIFTKAAALATGVTLVDLPGVHDSNLARAAVAKQFIQKCTGFWIVAPIIRAVHEKTAKDMLGQSFKRQLQMDGGYSSVTFICSKTDDISETEALGDTDLMPENRNVGLELARCRTEKESLQEKLATVEKDQDVASEDQAGLELKMEGLEEILDRVEKGEMVARLPGTNKRKAMNSLGQHRKHICFGTGGPIIDGHNGVVSGQVEDSGSHEDVFIDQEANISAETLRNEIKSLKEERHSIRSRSRKLRDRIQGLKQHISRVEREEKNLSNSVTKHCIQVRNGYSRNAIRSDYSIGMRELDEDAAFEEQKTESDFNVKPQNYQEIADNLPVFCVSARGYQMLQGRLMMDSRENCFTTAEETEIPALREHCRKLTTVARIAFNHSFLTGVEQVENSMKLWLSNEASTSDLTVGQQARQQGFLTEKLANLKKDLEQLIERLHEGLNGEISKYVFDRYPTAIREAKQAAATTVSHWGSPVNRGDRDKGGYPWATYKAICRRGGVYRNRRGEHDWNEQLLVPMTGHLASSWKHGFSVRAPTVLVSFARDVGSRLSRFHEEIEVRVHDTAGGAMLRGQLLTYKNNCKGLSKAIEQQISEQQKEINRKFLPAIQASMASGYEEASKKSGKGSFAKMKALMDEHVQRMQSAMFQASCNEVRRALMVMTQNAEDTARDKLNEVYENLSRDYHAALGAEHVLGCEMTPEVRRELRTKVRNIITMGLGTVIELD